MMIELINPANGSRLERKADVYTDGNGNEFPIIHGVGRIVSDGNYTDSFGFQWNKFEKTQIDRDTKNSQHSRERFFAESGWDKENLQGKNVLEVGSGAG